MNKMMAKLQKFGRIRQLHTIISQETIRPSSPTPPHLKTHNLSLLDQFAPDMHAPVVFFYQNYKKGDNNILKQSLSKCLTHFYPFTGRLSTPPATYVDCNDEGVDFLEASNDGQLDDFILKNKQDQTMDQLFPYGLSCSNRASSPKLLEVQLNHFSGGGAAVALSLSHKLIDAGTAIDFLNHWSTVTRGGTPKNPCFISSSTSNYNISVPMFDFKEIKDKINYVTSIFRFRNSKLNELKSKVISMSTVPMNPTRVEALTALIFKHAVSAAKSKSGSSEPSNLSVAVNLRDKFVEKIPETVVGNFITLAISKMRDSGEIRLNELIAEIRKGKTELEGVKDEQEVVEKLLNTFSSLRGDVYYTSSVCRVPLYDVDFGWGKPVEVSIRIPDVEEKTIILMDTPSGDGISTLVRLPEEEMAILQKDKEFLTYVENV